MITCGIIGYGKIGKIRASEIENNPETQLAVLYDVIERDAIPENIKWCSSVEELLNESIDAVFICSPNNVNAPYTIQALSKGKHVFCEKPPARTSKEIEEVIAAEKKSGKVLKYGFNHRYHHSVIEAKKIINNNVLGRMLWLRGVYGKAGGNTFASNWRNKRDISGGGILIDQGIHMLDLMRFFAGDFNHVQSLVQTSYWDIEVEDNVMAIMQGDNNISAMLHSSATQWRHKFSLDMCFEEGYINLDGILSSTRSYGDETLIIAKRQFEDTAFAMGKPREERIFFDTDESWKLEMDEFVDCIINNKRPIAGNSIDAFKIMKIIEEIYDKSGYIKG